MFWKKKKAKKPVNRDEILAQATKNVAEAREQIGEDTLDKIRRKLMEKENSALERAKRKIKAMDDDKVRDNISFWMRQKEDEK